jgi:hypothetical protein
MGKTRRNRVVAVLGAGGVLATVLSAAGPAALAQPASAPAVKVCPAIEALVSDGVSGPGLGGEVLLVNPGGQSTLTTNTSPPGAPRLDTPSDMAFLPNGDIVITDEGSAGSVPDVVEVDPATGARTLISGRGRGSGPAVGATDPPHRGVPAIRPEHPGSGSRQRPAAMIMVRMAAEDEGALCAPI